MAVFIGRNKNGDTYRVESTAGKSRWGAMMAEIKRKVMIEAKGEIWPSGLSDVDEAVYFYGNPNGQACRVRMRNGGYRFDSLGAVAGNMPPGLFVELGQVTDIMRRRRVMLRRVIHALAVGGHLTNKGN